MQVSMATQRAVTTQYCHTDKLVETLTNPNTCQGHMMKTSKGGGGSGTKKRHSTTGGKQQTKMLLECNTKALTTKPVNSYPCAWLL